MVSKFSSHMYLSLILGKWLSLLMQLFLKNKVDQFLHPGGARIQTHLLPACQSSTDLRDTFVIHRQDKRKNTKLITPQGASTHTVFSRLLTFLFDLSENTS